MNKIKISLLASLLFVSIMAMAQNDTAIAQKVEGKYIFLNSEPTMAYTTAFTFESRYDPRKGNTLDKQISQILQVAFLESGKQDKPFDAILLGDTERDIAIKFSDTPDGRCKAKKIDGLLTFIMCEPVTSYDVTIRIAHKRTAGTTYFSNSQVVANVSKKAFKLAKKKGCKFDAVAIGNDALHLAIKFR